MHLAEIIIGFVVLVAAVVSVILAIEKTTVIAFGAAVVFGTVGGFSLYTGIHGYHSVFYAKHQAIVRDLARQGITVASGDVYAVGGHYLGMSTEADVRAGFCVFPLIARKLDGVWRVVLPNAGNGSTSGGVVILTAADVARFGRDCR